MSFASLMDSPAWIAAGWTMIHLTWVGLIVGMIAATGRRMMNEATPEARYTFALLCLLGFGASPVVLFARSLPPDASPAAKTYAATPGGATRPRNPGSEIDGSRSRPRPPVASLPLNPRDGRTALDAWVARLPWAWLAGSLGSLVAVGTGLIGVERLRRSSRVVDEDGEIGRACRALAGSLGIARRVGVAACDRLAAPVLIGLVRPLILLPTAAFDSWSLGQVEMALLHELAHLRRWDNHVNLLQRGVESALFFHPVAWWLSAWVRLERESCCDRLVVARTGRPCSYAKMLAGLAGSGREPGGGGGRIAALGMADRQVTTRIRRILDMEDRSMRITLPEGCGLLGASALALALALGYAQAAPPAAPAAKPDEALRLAFRKAADETLAAAGGDGEAGRSRASALVGIAETRIKLGDRDAALASLDRVFEAEIGRVEHAPATELRKTAERINGLIEIARLRRESGDLASARNELGRVVPLIERIPVDPAEKPKVTEGEVGMRRVEEENGAMFRAELLGAVAMERIALGDLAEARAILKELVPILRTQDEPLRSLYIGGLGAYLATAGDPAGARVLIDEAKASASAIAEPDERAKALCYVAQSLAQVGDFPAAFAMARSLREAKHESKALGMIVDGLTDHDSDDETSWVEIGGIKILIGATGKKPKDAGAARRDLPAIGKAVAESEIPGPERARVLSKIAHLQAMAGDLAGARATAEGMPEVRRGDFPGPADGLYDAVKPGTLAPPRRARRQGGRSRRLGRPVPPGDRVRPRHRVRGRGDPRPDHARPRAGPGRPERRRPRLAPRGGPRRPPPARAPPVAVPGHDRQRPGRGRRPRRRRRDRRADPRRPGDGEGAGPVEPRRGPGAGRRP